MKSHTSAAFLDHSFAGVEPSTARHHTAQANHVCMHTCAWRAAWSCARSSLTERVMTRRSFGCTLPRASSARVACRPLTSAEFLACSGNIQC